MHLKLFDEALDQIAEAQADEVRTGDKHFTAELHRLKGECLLALSLANAGQAGYPKNYWPGSRMNIPSQILTPQSALQRFVAQRD